MPAYEKQIKRFVVVSCIIFSPPFLSVVSGCLCRMSASQALVFVGVLDNAALTGEVRYCPNQLLISYYSQQPLHGLPAVCHNTHIIARMSIQLSSLKITWSRFAVLEPMLLDFVAGIVSYSYTRPPAAVTTAWTPGPSRPLSHRKMVVSECEYRGDGSN